MFEVYVFKGTFSESEIVVFKCSDMQCLFIFAGTSFCCRPVLMCCYTWKTEAITRTCFILLNKTVIRKYVWNRESKQCGRKYGFITFVVILSAGLVRTLRAFSVPSIKGTQLWNDEQ